MYVCLVVLSYGLLYKPFCKFILALGRGRRNEIDAGRPSLNRKRIRNEGFGASS